MIKLVVVGKLKEKSLKALVDEYLKRLQGYAKIEIIEVSDEKIPDTNSEKENELAKFKEGERILSKIKEQEYVILLDLWGKEINSIEFANKLQSIQTYKTSNITFVIAGSLGFGDNVLNRSNYRMKLSDLTFPHQIVRLLLVEQIYRAYKIINNETYHK